MKHRIPATLLVLAGLTGTGALAEPAARQGDATNLGGQIVSGAATVFVGGSRAARQGDQTTAPLSIGLVPCVGGPIITDSATVRIEGLPAARVGDTATTQCGLVSTIVIGEPTVLIGD